MLTSLSLWITFGRNDKMKKISTAGLKQLIREELFYREFYRDAGALNEDHDDDRIAAIIDAKEEGKLHASMGVKPAGGHPFQRDYDNAYVDATAEKGLQLMIDAGRRPPPSVMQSHTQDPQAGGGWACAVCEDYADQAVGDAVHFDDPMYTAIVKKVVKLAGGNPEAYDANPKPY